MNTHTAFIRSLGIAGVLLALSLALLAFVSAVVAFDRWPEGAGASAVERVAVEPSEGRRVETVVVRSRPGASVVRGVTLAGALAVSTSSGSGGALPTAGGTSERPNGGGFGPPPPRVGVRPPGEGGDGTVRQVASTGGGGGGPEDENPIQEAACDARDTLSGASPDAGQALTPACDGRRQTVRETLTALGKTVESLTGVGLVRR